MTAREFDGRNRADPLTDVGRTPLVSIGMPVYNGMPHLQDALASLLAQDHTDLELIISDNASTDGTSDHCIECAQRDARIRYYRQPQNVGPVANFNAAFALARGRYFMWASHDDWWASGYIRTCLDAFRQSKGLVLAGTRGRCVEPDTARERFVDLGLSTIGLSPAARYIRYKRALQAGNHVGVIFYGVYKRDALASVLPLLNVIATDHLLLAKLALRGEFVTVPESLMVKGLGGISRSYETIARELGITSRFAVRHPMLLREQYLQRIIATSPGLGASRLLQLALWSAANLLAVDGRLAIVNGIRRRGGRWKRILLRGNVPIISRLLALWRLSS